MDTVQLVELLKNAVSYQATHSDVTEFIQTEYSTLDFNPHKSRDKSEAFGRVWKVRQRAHMALPDDIWSRYLMAWAESSVSSILLFQGDLVDRDRLKEIQVKVTKEIEARAVPLAWAFSVLPSSDDQGQAKEYIEEDIIAQICFQILRQNPRLYEGETMKTCLSKCQAAVTLSEWFNVLTYFADGLKEAYIIVDLDMLRKGSSNADSWPCALESMCKMMGESCTIKGLLFTCNARPSFEPSSDINIADISSRHTAPSRARASANVPKLDENNDSWVQHIGRSASKHRRSVTKNGSDHNDDDVCAADMVYTTSPSKSWAYYWQTEFEACIDANRKYGNKKVKIAVLDTGADLRHPDISKAIEDGRVRSYDFINDREQVVDYDGHGTYCASLVLNFASNAEVLIARVFDKEQSSSTEPMIKAIKAAYSDWHVDIISISLGFSNPNPKMEYEIARAVAEGVLVFASAANNTVHEQRPIRFPASMPQVFCIFSADASGKSSDFNPEPNRESFNFMFPGENIQGAWPANQVQGVPGIITEGGRTYRSMSGTSCATPIAASVAAGVLEWVWQPEKGPMENVHRFKTFGGMQKVFREMARDTSLSHRDLYYVMPWLVISTLKNKQGLHHVLQYFIDKQ